MGRCLVACRPLAPMELILTDAPAATAPDEAADAPVCLGCFDCLGGGERQERRVPCPRCGLALFCSEPCASSSSGLHAKFECQVTSERPRIAASVNSKSQVRHSPLPSF